MLQHRCKALSFPIFLSTLLLSLVPLVTQAKITTNDLYLAVKQGEVSTVKQLISAGVDVNTVLGYASGSKGTPLLVAIKQTDIDGETREERWAKREAEGQIINDIRICGPFKDNEFKKVQKNLKKYHNTTLKQSYFDIECEGMDLLGLVIKSPVDRYFPALHLEVHFKKKEKIPTFFTKMLLNEIDGRNMLRRIALQLRSIRSSSLRGSVVEERLVKLQTKYIAYLKKHPIPGSAKALSAHQQWVSENL